MALLRPDVPTARPRDPLHPAVRQGTVQYLRSDLPSTPLSSPRPWPPGTRRALNTGASYPSLSVCHQSAEAKLKDREEALRRKHREAAAGGSVEGLKDLVTDMRDEVPYRTVPYSTVQCSTDDKMAQCRAVQAACPQTAQTNPGKTPFTHFPHVAARCGRPRIAGGG